MSKIDFSKIATEKEEHGIKLFKEELEKGIISFINFALRIIEIFRLRVKISKMGIYHYK